MKKLCKGEDCFKMVSTDDYVTRADGTIHRLSMLCEDCITPAQKRSLKNYKKHLRHKANIAARVTPPTVD